MALDAKLKKAMKAGYWKRWNGKIQKQIDENIEKYTPNKYFIPAGENIPEVVKNMPKAQAFKKGTLEKIIAQMFKKCAVLGVKSQKKS